MIIKKNVATTLLSGTILSLAMATAPLHAQSDTTDEMAVEAEENMEAAGEAVDEMAAEAEENMEAAGDEIAAEVEGLDDLDETAMMIQDKIAADPQLGVYQLEVRKTDGSDDMYEVTGMMDKSEDFASLQRLLGDIDGVDASQIENRVVVQ